MRSRYDLFTTNDICVIEQEVGYISSNNEENDEVKKNEAQENLNRAVEQ